MTNTTSLDQMLGTITDRRSVVKAVGALAAGVYTLFGGLSSAEAAPAVNARKMAIRPIGEIQNYLQNENPDLYLSFWHDAQEKGEKREGRKTNCGGSTDAVFKVSYNELVDKVEFSERQLREMLEEAYTSHDKVKRSSGQWGNYWTKIGTQQAAAILKLVPGYNLAAPACATHTYGNIMTNHPSIIDQTSLKYVGAFAKLVFIK